MPEQYSETPEDTGRLIFTGFTDFNSWKGGDNDRDGAMVPNPARLLVRCLHKNEGARLRELTEIAGRPVETRMLVTPPASVKNIHAEVYRYGMAVIDVLFTELKPGDSVIALAQGAKRLPNVETVFQNHFSAFTPYGTEGHGFPTLDPDKKPTDKLDITKDVSNALERLDPNLITVGIGDAGAFMCNLLARRLLERWQAGSSPGILVHFPFHVSHSNRRRLAEARDNHPSLMALPVRSTRDNYRSLTELVRNFANLRGLWKRDQ